MFHLFYRYLIIYVLLYFLPLAFTIQIVLPIPFVLLWSISKKVVSREVLEYYLELVLRLFIFFYMMIYGLAKVFTIQFQPTNLSDLITPLGQIIPMGLLWQFMGYSSVYQIFTGLLEVIGGYLMLFQRTTTLGALITFGVMANVALLNFVFYVPVKVLSSHLALFALFLIFLDRKRLFQFFIKNEQTEIKHERRITNRPTIDKLFKRLKFILSLTLLMSVFFGLGYSFYDKNNSKSLELTGIYSGFNSNKANQNHTFFDNWKYLAIDSKRHAVVRMKDDTISRFRLIVDKENKTLNFESKKDDELAFIINYTVNRDALILEDKEEGLKVSLIKIETESFPLISKKGTLRGD